jgi:signal transduction histidine kinase
VQRQSEDHLLRYCSAAKDLRISGDPDLLRILILNLLENAVHYSPEGGSIQVRAAAQDGSVTIAVRDEGIGIPPEARERIFDRYYRTPQVKDAIGAGLGLYIVRSIARLHGGDVSCDSTLGEGSTFRVSLRRTRAG